MSRKSKKTDELARALQLCRRHFLTAGIFSLGINLLYLAAPLYMLQVYDRVISSSSKSTLAMLTIALLVAFITMAGLDWVRARILARAGIRLDRVLGGRVMAATFATASRGDVAGSQPLRDFDTFRLFLSGQGISALFDLPWAPVYVFVIFMLHPWMGAFALGCVIVLLLTAVIGEHFARKPLAESTEAANKSYRFTETSLRNSEVVQAMGMMPRLLERWGRERNRMMVRQDSVAARMAATGSFTKMLRLAMQSLILGLGAYLVIERSATMGAMFAGTLLLARALQPVELIVGSWRTIASARGAFERLKGLLGANPSDDDKLSLPRPTGRVEVQAVSYGLRNTSRIILSRVDFAIQPSEVVGVVGPSGSGKSTLARLLVGLIAPFSGTVRLDGADLTKWPRDELGPHIGYLPQDVELFADTVASNISRFRDGDDSGVIDAAQLAGVHEAILALPEGYDTQVGEGGAALPGGLRQRIGLARAVYGSPCLVVLDEPNSNLDNEGEAALAECIKQLKMWGTTVVVISHRPAALNVVDKVLVMKDGTVAAFGPRDEVLKKITRPVQVKAAPADRQGKLSAKPADGGPIAAEGRP
ncbi:MAG: type I secretion system permease/ATPase [Alphaproteobacteria bacterium]|nr:type I secretion system permease/ATPase [Alphaproteobacteria bacterium]MCW5744310.1 type I secretion system permease/ATPase [Alphaproteobacteria bacterium]